MTMVTMGPVGLIKSTRKQKLFSIIVTMVMGPMGLMKSSIKQKLFAIIGLFLRIYVG